MDSQIIFRLKQFSTISLSEMKSVKLMNRIDTKYITTKNRIPEILQAVQENYFVQAIGENPVAHYQTLYYDTPDLQMYVAHHNRKLNRQKIRTRIYTDSDLAFCEIKNKTNKGRTKKKRIEISLSEFDNILNNEKVLDFIKANLNYDANSLVRQVENSFDRITLVNANKTERITIDSNLSFFNRNTNCKASMEDVAIIELKQDGRYDSQFKSSLCELRIFPKRISKYCLGTILTNENAKNNRFKAKLRYINKVLIH